MEALLKAILEMIVNFFSPKEDTDNDLVLDYVPQFGDKSRNTLLVQKRLNKFIRLNLTEDGDFGPKTLAAAQAFQKSVGLPGSGKLGTITIKELGLTLKSDNKPTPIQPTNSNDPVWMKELEKHKGKHESDPAFQEYMNAYWAKSGLPNFKGLVGSARAWCGLFVFMGLVVAGYKTPVNSFRAKAWDGYGHAINWKQDGIPRGAIIRINSSGNCSAASGNHVTTANGDCTAADLTKANATIGAYGGNQGNQAKVSIYKVSTICYVGWPKETLTGAPVEKPSKVTKSNNCTGTGSTTESTR